MSDTLQTVAPAGLVGPYRHEKILFAFVAVFSILFWLLLSLLTVGIVWIYMAFFYLCVLMAHSALISHLKGNAVRIDARQFPELYARIQACSQRVGLEQLPESYLMSGSGILNAFATRFLRRYYVVLLSDIIDALEADPEGVNFYIGHELGHIARQHVAYQWWMGPVLLLPLLGTAYRRAQEYTCDQYGVACCASLDVACRAMAVLVAGPRRWKQLDIPVFIGQTAETGEFWMSLNELTSEYPWLCKRMGRIHDPKMTAPRRHPLAWFLSMFLPSAGPGGLVVSLVLLFAVLGMLAAIAIPTYQGYIQRAAYPAAFAYTQELTRASQAYYEANQELAGDAAILGLASAPANVEEITLDSGDGQIRMTLKNQEVILLQPYVGEEEKLGWNCATTIAAAAIPPGFNCNSMPGNDKEMNPLENLFKQLKLARPA